MRKVQFNFNEHNQSLESLENYYDEVKAAIDLKYSGDTNLSPVTTCHHIIIRL